AGVRAVLRRAEPAARARAPVTARRNAVCRFVTTSTALSYARRRSLQQVGVMEPAADTRPVLLKEIDEFVVECDQRCEFNTHWDNVMNAAGILLSVMIVAAGVFGSSRISAILGGSVAAIVTAQRAFPFNQRLLFYRNLLGQARNLGLS